MKKMSTIIVAMLSVFILLPNAMAASSEVTWTSPEKYRDIHPGEENKKRFQERVMKNLEEHILKLAEKLPEGQSIKMNVTDVDLAGDVNHGSIHRVRVVKDLYFPRMKFEYELVSSDGKTIDKGEVDLKDMNFLRTGHLKYRTDSLGHEKKMLDDWFKDTFMRS